MTEVESSLEQLKAEREVALKYKTLKDEKAGLDAQVGTVKFFDLKRSLEAAHENILKVNKDLKEKQAEKKDTEEKIKLVEAKYKELEAKLKEQGEEEREKLKDAQRDLTTRINTKKQAIEYSDTQIQKSTQAIENAKNGIETYKKKIEDERLNIKCANEKQELLKVQLDEKKAELAKKLSDISGLSSTADKYVQERSDVSKRIDELKDKDNELLKNSVPLESDLRVAKKELEDAKNFIQEAEEAKANYSDDKSLKELQVSQLKKDMDDLKEIQAKTLQQFDDSKTALEQLDHDIKIAYRKFTDMEAQRRAASSSGSSIPITTVMNANLEGVHAPLMQLGSVDEEYSLALDIAFGGRLAHIVVEDTHAAYVAMELLKSSRAGRATFIPLNKVKKAPNKLQLPRNSKGVIDFAINLVDFDDLYIDAFYYAVGDTLVVEDAEAAERLMGQYRMVTLDGKLYEKSAAITGGYVKKSIFGFGQNDDKELESAKAKLDDLQKRYDETLRTKKSLDDKLDQVRVAHSSASTEYSKAKIELSNMSSQYESSQKLLDVKKEIVKTNEPKIQKLNSDLDKIEEKRVELSDEIQKAQDKLSELDELLNDKDLKDLKEKTQGIEDDIRRVNQSLSAVDSEIKDYENTIKFNDQLILAKNEDITNTTNNIKELEKDKVTYANEIVQLEEQSGSLSDKIAVIEEKIGELLKEKDKIFADLTDIKAASTNQSRDIDNLNENIEALKNRRKELEPKLKEAADLLTDSGVNVDKLEPVEMSIDELTQKIQRLEKKMQDLGDVNMRAIVSYDEKLARKEELDTQIKTLSTERQSILDKMNGFEQQKKEAFMTTFTAINENFKDIYHQLSEGEGKLILENENDPLSAGMTIEAKPRDKTSNNKLGALSGGEKALTALALVFSIQRYLPAPFYALDEVDASLDTMNVERIADMVKKQSSDTQFIVVSHRRPMIEAASRTIGVTQKEKGKTKVTGVKLRDDDEQ